MINIQECKDYKDFPIITVYYDDSPIGILNTSIQYSEFKLKLIQEKDEEISKYSIKVNNGIKNYKFNIFANFYNEENPLIKEYYDIQFNIYRNFVELQVNKRKSLIKSGIKSDDNLL